MNLLLDTQAWLWLQVTPERLNGEATALVEDLRTRLFLSAASSWEISVKYGLGKLPLPVPPAEYVPVRMRDNGVRGLPVTHRHALHVATLPPHHRDPFDRMLIAQAQLEDLTVLTADRRFEKYDVPVRWAD
ncbi:MAG TPA: type II toxin-antitoxin system VapC family toxin [Actinophytocola sp.]|nr:type II toxin-antitoxin system VapC family toxin [Actinophytocola sp.]